jgi:hypothetical protein
VTPARIHTRRPWFPAQPVDETFFDTAPFRMSDTFETSHPASYVWRELTAAHPLNWCRMLREVSWTSSRPLGVGATRTATALAGAMVLHEQFFRWEEGRQHSFYALDVSAPLFRRWAEDCLVEPISECSCRLTWVIAIEPRSVARPANPLNRLVLGTLFHNTRRHFGLA